jgi:hypothetical protein
MVGAGAVVTRNVPQNAIPSVGNPAYITGYVSHGEKKQPLKFEMPSRNSPFELTSSVRGVHIYKLPVITDIRGSISVAQYGQYLPFIPQRYFLVFDVVSNEVRGEHAHLTLQ